MRSKSPNVATVDIANARVSVYCKALVAQGETDTAVTAKLQTFAGSTYQRLAQ